MPLSEGWEGRFRNFRVGKRLVPEDKVRAPLDNPI